MIIKIITNQPPVRVNKKSSTLTAVCLIFTCTLTTPTLAENTSVELGKRSIIIKNKIDTYLTKIAKKNFSGAVLIEYKGDKILSKGYGHSDKQKSINYTENTISDIGSVTKQFTAAAILKLEMQGKLSTTDKLSKYFYDLPKDKASITLHELLNMSSGLQMYSGGDYEPVTEKAFIKIIHNQKLHFKPGTSFEYSNPNYSILALLIERVSGMSYESYLYKNLFKPAMMEQTGYSRPTFVSNNIAVQHKYGIATKKPTEKLWEGEQPFIHLKGNGGILSTVEDLYKWHKALLSDKILSSKAKKKYYKPYLEAFRGQTINSYAYGWYNQNTIRNTTLIYHQGSNNESFTDFFRFVDEDITIILVSNNFDGFSRKVHKQIQGMIFDPNFTPSNKSGYRSLDELINKGLNIEQIITLLKIETNSLTTSEYNISLNTMNRFGYSFVTKNKFNEAKKIFELNIALHPNSADAYDYYAESLLLSGNIKAGIEVYRKALALNPKFKNSHTAHKVIQEYEDFMTNIINIYN